MPDMGRGIIAPANGDNIGTGASEMRTLASTAATAIDALEASTGAALDGKVGTSDPRLSDARTPLAHTHPVSDVAGLQTALDGKARKEPIDLADQNLNDVIDEGPYVQTSGAAATAARNYPATASGARQAGLLEVTSRPGDYLVFQRYTTFNGGEMSFRARYGGTWYAWERAFRAAEAAPLQADVAKLKLDTGGRQIAAALPAYISGEFMVRRIRDTVYVSLYELQVSETNPGYMIQTGFLPSGFRPALTPYLYYQGTLRNANYTAGPFRVDRYGGITIYDVKKTDGSPKIMSVAVSWPTNDPWPTTPPGTPA